VDGRKVKSRVIITVGIPKKLSNFMHFPEIIGILKITEKFVMISLEGL